MNEPLKSSDWIAVAQVYATLVQARVTAGLKAGIPLDLAAGFLASANELESKAHSALRAAGVEDA